MWVCNQCGNRNYDNSRFCTQCGNSKEKVENKGWTISNIHLAIYIFLGVIIVGLVILVFVLVKSGTNNENSVENNATITDNIYESLPAETTQPTPASTPMPTPVVTSTATPTPMPTPTPPPTPTPLFGSDYTGDLSEYTEKIFSSAFASSELYEGDILFAAKYAIDSGINRPWVESVNGNGVGETLTLYFDNKETITFLSFQLGYARNQDLYDINNRPSKMRISFSDGSGFDYSFRDVNQEQNVKLSKEIDTDWVKLTIQDVYSGTVCDDTCIYLVRAYG